MRALIINSVCAALAFGGCASKSSVSLVVVSVDADAPLADVATLHARVTVADQTREFDVHPTSGATLSIPPAQNFGIDIPRSMSGTLAIHVEARDSNGNVTATGDGSGPIRVGGRADVGVSLAVVDNSGDMGETMSGDMAVAPGSDMAKPTGDMIVVPPAMFTIDKSSQSFGDITVGKTSTTASFLVINAGGMASSVATLTTSGANIGEFSVDTDCGPSLPPGGRCHVTASITPTSAGMKSGTFTLTAAQGGSVGGMLTANALTPGAVKIAQSSGDCGSALLGVPSTTTASFTVQNTGASPTTALGVTMSDPQFVATGCSGMTLAAGAMCTVTVKFTPTASGTQNASLTVSATTGGTDTASVVGVGLKPAALSVAPPSYSFASIARGTTSTETATFTVSNSGDVASASMSAATLSGANPASFAIMSDGCKGAPVGPAPAACSIVVQFKPQMSGTNNATLNVTAGSSTVGTPSLTGVGLNPSALKLSPSAMTTFTKGQTATFTVTNDGEVASGALSTAMLGGTNAASFSISADNCAGKSIGPSPASCTIDVKFAPTTTGTQTATLSLAATPGGSLSATLGGPGLNPATLVMSPAMPTFTKGQTITFTVTNSGELASGTLGTPTLGGANAASFSIAANGCNAKSVGPPPASCTIDVKFAPTTTGTQSATLSIAATPGGTASSTLGGPGLNPASLRLSPDHYAFATTPRLSTTGPTGTFTLTNDGDVASSTMALATVTGSGANAQSFTITNDGCQGRQIGPSPGSCTITIRFTPQLTGANSATLNINTSSATVIMAALTGTGAATWVQEAVDLTLSPLHAVWAADATHVYAVGENGTIVYRDPTNKWSIRTLSATAPLPTLVSISGTSATDVYVAGGGIFHSSNNSTWTVWEAGKFSSVIAFNSLDVWGSYYYLDSNSQAQSAIYRFLSGTGWTQVKNGDGSLAPGLGFLWGTSGSDLYSFGADLRCGLGSCSSDAVIRRPNGTGNWVSQYDANLPNPTAAVTSMWGFGTPANDIYATTTTSDTPLHSSGDGTWTPMTGAPAGCAAVWGTNATNIWFACGNSLYSYDGSTWTAASTSFVGYGIFGTDANNVYAVGEDSAFNGVIYHYY